MTLLLISCLKPMIIAIARIITIKPRDTAIMAILIIGSEKLPVFLLINRLAMKNSGFKAEFLLFCKPT